MPRHRAGHDEDVSLKRLFFFLCWLLIAILISSCSTFASPKYDGPITETFDGEHFVNQDPVRDHGFLDMLRWTVNRDRGPWPNWIESVPGPKPPNRVGQGELRVTFVNHATMLVQIDGLNILSDPVWSMRVGPKPWLGVKRHRDPGIRLEDLPPIDVIMISHNHYDHLDMPTLKRLAKKHNPKILAGLGVQALLQQNGLTNAQDLDWWEETQLGEIAITFVPARHWSSRGLTDRKTSLWGGFVVTSASGSVYFAGDTGWGQHFEQVGKRFAPIRLAILPIGAYRPRWFMRDMHISPDEAVNAHEVLNASTSIGMHFGTFPLADDGQLEPTISLELAKAKRYPHLPRFWTLQFGEGMDVPEVAEAVGKAE